MKTTRFNEKLFYDQYTTKLSDIVNNDTIQMMTMSEWELEIVKGALSQGFSCLRSILY